MVVIGSLGCNCVVDGLVFTFGAFLKSIAETFDASTPAVALSGSLIAGVFMFVAPIVGALCDRFGFRVTTIAGSLIACCGFVASSWATNVEYLYVTHGIISGNFTLVFRFWYYVLVFRNWFWVHLFTIYSVCGILLSTMESIGYSDCCVWVRLGSLFIWTLKRIF